MSANRPRLCVKRRAEQQIAVDNATMCEIAPATAWRGVSVNNSTQRTMTAETDIASWSRWRRTVTKWAADLMCRMCRVGDQCAGQ